MPLVLESVECSLCHLCSVSVYLHHCSKTYEHSLCHGCPFDIDLFTFLVKTFLCMDV